MQSNPFFNDNTPGRSNQLYEARIRNEYYTIHNYAAVNGISHECYNDAVSRELDRFILEKKTSRGRLTPTQAKEFLDRIKGSTDFVISRFNSGVHAEADEAARIGARVYAQTVSRLGTKKAFELARTAASEAAIAKRAALNAAAQAAGQAVVRQGGKWVVRAAKIVPFVGGAYIYLSTGDAKAAANEICLDVIASPIGLARDGGLLMGAGYEALLEEHNRSIDSIRGWINRPHIETGNKPRIRMHGITLD